MRFEYTVPAAAGRNEITSTAKADNEQHMRALIRAWLGHQAAIDAIVRPVPDGDRDCRSVGAEE